MARLNTILFSVVRNFIFLLLFIDGSPFNTSGQNKISSLLSSLKTDKQDTIKVERLGNISWQYYLEGNTEKALVYGDSAIALAQKANGFHGMAAIFANMGTIYANRQEYSNAWNMFSKAMQLYRNSSDKDGIAILNNDIGELYFIQGNYPEALHYFLKALTLEQELKNNEATADIMDNLGVLYFKQGDYNASINYYSKALKLFDTDADQLNKATILGNIGIDYERMKDIEAAMRYYKMAISLETKIADVEGIARNKNNLGGIYEHLNNYDSAIHYYVYASTLAEKIDNKELLATTYGNIGVVYLKQKKYEQAEDFFLKSYSINNKAYNLDGLEENYKDLSELYELTGQLPKAFNFFKQYVAAKDSLVNEGKSKEIGRIEAKVEFDKQLAFQQADEDKKVAVGKAESKRQKIFILLIAIIAFMAISLAINIFRLLKATRKQKLLVEKQKVLQELKTLRTQMNPHFIFNAINSIKNVVLENNSAAASKHLVTFSKLMREVLENSKCESIPLVKELHMLELYIELELLRFSSKFIYSITIDDTINTENVLISPLIIQPYVENAIWHGLMHLENRKGELLIKIENMNNGMLKCTIDDNGIGREKSAEAKKGRIHNSMGLSITQERLEIINSLYESNISIHITDKKDKDGSSAGTCVELLWPLSLN